MSEPEHLPLELFQLVIYYCRFNRTSLLNLSLVCRAFLEETRPLVFPFLRIHGRNIQKLIPLVLSPHCSIPDATFTSGITFFLNTPGDLHWLANSFVPQVEGKVRLIALTLAVQYAHPGPLQDVADILQPLRFTSLVHFQYYNFFTDRLDDVVSVLCSMPVLDSVKLQGIARDPSVDPGRRLSTTTLHTLHVSIPEPRQIAEWLNSHEVSPRLRRLVFGNIMENDVDAVNALINVNGPYLKEFIANFPGHAPFDFTNCEELETLYVQAMSIPVVCSICDMLTSIHSTSFRRLWVDFDGYPSQPFTTGTDPDEPWSELDSILTSPIGAFTHLDEFKLGLRVIDETDVAPYLPRCIEEGRMQLVKLTNDVFSRIACPGQALTLPKVPWVRNKARH